MPRQAPTNPGPSASTAPIGSGFRRRKRGFTLVEMLVVVTIISLLGLFAIPAVRRVQRRAQLNTIINDFRVFAAAFDAYALENGRWPNDSGVGVIPTGMANALKNTSWTRITPTRGYYNWEYNKIHLIPPTVRAAISINSGPGSSIPTVSDPNYVNLLLDLERAIDGSNFNLIGGTFRLGSGLCPVYVIEQ